MAEIIPFEPDTDNAGVGSGKTKTVIGAISYEGKRVWLFCETTIPQAERRGIGKSNNPRSEA
jgi:hypothetical protein